MPKRSLPKTKAMSGGAFAIDSQCTRGATVGGPKSRGVIAVAQT